MIPEDERIQRYERAVVMTILGLSYAMRKLEKEYLEESDVKEIWKGFVKEKRVWKLIKHKNSMV